MARRKSLDDIRRQVDRIQRSARTIYNRDVAQRIASGRSTSRNTSSARKYRSRVRKANEIASRYANNAIRSRRGRYFDENTQFSRSTYMGNSNG